MTFGAVAIPITILLLLLALMVAIVVARLLAKAAAGDMLNSLMDMLLWGLLSARIAFVAIWFEIYRSAPWTMLDIRDGGFNPWAGIGAALLVAVWRCWRQVKLRKPLSVGLAAAAIAWWAGLGAIHLMENATIPSVQLSTLANESVSLASIGSGKPMVINLWATWCPPCRREMPVLAAAQKQEADVVFIFANQGEGGMTVQRYLAEARLDLANVLLDPAGKVGREVGSGGLPTTLFYDANGHLVDSHLGALSTATLASKLAALAHRAN
jgi:thiol-disulfide isomerase/thioredoxin